uniref:Secreted protein n=1 Tax=Plectus sambesii TaxID=2011161 RepID=A0A914XDT5_9BILA
MWPAQIAQIAAAVVVTTTLPSDSKVGQYPPDQPTRRSDERTRPGYATKRLLARRQTPDQGAGATSRRSIDTRRSAVPWRRKNRASRHRPPFPTRELHNCIRRQSVRGVKATGVKNMKEGRKRPSLVVRGASSLSEAPQCSTEGGARRRPRGAGQGALAGRLDDRWRPSGA